MADDEQHLDSLIGALRHDLAGFAKRERVSIIEMVSLVAAIILHLGIQLERTAGLVDRAKTYDVPLAGELLEVVAAFGERQHLSPVEMLAVLGGTIIEFGAEMEVAVN